MGTRSAVALYLTGFLAALFVAPVQSGAQSLLAIPDLNPVGVLTGRGPDSIKALLFRVMPPISSEASEVFWAEERKSVLPGSSVGVGTGRAAIYTEIAKVLSGAWRFSAGTTLSVAARDSVEALEPGEQPVTTAFGRFVAGGGNLSLQGVRPLILANFGEHTGGALLFLPRGWLNVPELSSAEGISDYGGEAAASLLVQRRDNLRHPFLSLEVRGGVVVGSTEFFQAVGSTEDNTFSYLAPSLTFAMQDQVNIGVSTFISSAFKNKRTVTLTLTLLNKGRTPAERADQRQTVASRLAARQSADRTRSPREPRMKRSAP